MNEYRAYSYLNRINPLEKVADLYDEDEMLAMAVNALHPNFEYPDHSHRTVGELLKHIECQAK